MYILYEIFHDTNPIHLGALNNNGGRYEKLLLLWLFVVVVTYKKSQLEKLAKPSVNLSNIC